MKAVALSRSLEDRFFITGGTLASDAASYIRRSADEELFKSLSSGEFCYVLNARQMGKSSLMVSTAGRLAAEGIRTVVIDLTSIGQNVTLEQWYFGVLATMCDQLGLQDDLLDYWKKLVAFSPQQRWLTTLREYILPRVSGQLVIFVDEIDLVRSLDFRTDEFFAGIREMHNRRSTDPEARRVTFCLLGVVTPAELIEDPNTTPFNIGVRIPLSDFTHEEADALGVGLNHWRDRAALLHRVLYWTDGHPYLTQRLCRAIAEDDSIRRGADVDEACRRIFFSHEGRDRDDNLLFVRERLISGEKGVLLHAYMRVLRGPMRAEYLAPATLASLVLSGVVKVKDGVIRVRNRLYAQAFDRTWVMDRLPTAEARRVKRAFWSGVLRTGVVLGGLSVALGLSLVWAVRERNSATTERNRANDIAYDADISLADRMLHSESPDQDTVVSLLHESESFGKDVKDRFEWRYLWHLSHPFRTVIHLPLPVPQRGSFGISSRPAALVSKGKVIALGEGPVLSLWRAVDGVRFAAHDFGEKIHSLTCDRDGRRVAVAFKSSVLLWDVQAVKTIFRAPLSGPMSPSYGRFSRDGRYFAISGWDGKEVLASNVDVFEVSSGRRLASTNVRGLASAPDFDPRSERLVVGCDKGIMVCGLSQHQVWSIAPESHGPVMALAFDSGGTRLFVGNDQGLQILDPTAFHALRTFDQPALAPEILVTSVKQDRTFLLSRTGMVYRTDEETGETFVPFPAPPRAGSRISVGVDGLLLSVGPNLQLWRADQNEPRLEQRRAGTSAATFESFSGDGGSILLGGDWVPGVQIGLDATKAGEKSLPEVESSCELGTVKANILRRGGVIIWGSNSPAVLLKGEKLWQADLCDGGRRLLTLTRGGSLVLWDLQSLHPITSHDGVSFAACTKDGARLVAAPLGPLDKYSSDFRRAAQSLILWDHQQGWSTWEPATNRKLANGLLFPVTFQSPAYSPDGSTLLYVKTDPTPSLVRIQFGLGAPKRDSLAIPSTSANFLVPIPGGRTAAIALAHGHVVLMSLATGKWLVDLAPPNVASEISCLTVSPSGDKIAAAYDNGTLCIWSAPWSQPSSTGADGSKR